MSDDLKVGVAVYAFLGSIATWTGWRSVWKNKAWTVHAAIWVPIIGGILWPVLFAVYGYFRLVDKIEDAREQS